MSLEIQFFGNSSFSLVGGAAIYIDPYQLGKIDIGADFILISHGHQGHFSPMDIERIAVPNTRILGPSDVVDRINNGRARVLLPDRETLDTHVRIKGIPAYNRRSEVHKRSDKGLGFVIEIRGKRVYFAGDTDLIAEMEELGPIDIAILPVGGGHVMDYHMAARAVKVIKPKLAIPYHYGKTEATILAGESFSDLATCIVKVMIPGDKITLV